MLYNGKKNKLPRYYNDKIFTNKFQKKTQANELADYGKKREAEQESALRRKGVKDVQKNMEERTSVYATKIIDKSKQGKL